MHIMASRYIHLQHALAGYEKTGTPLIEFDGNNLVPSFTADDIGIYVLIPKLAHNLGISLDNAVNFFFYGLLFIPMIIGLLGFFAFYKKLSSRIIVTIAMLFLVRCALIISDVYLAYFTCAVALIPWSLYFLHEKKLTTLGMFFGFFAGLLLGFCHYIRAYSGLGVFFFILFSLVLVSRDYWRQKGIFLSLLVLGLMLPTLYFSSVYDHYKIYTKNNLSNYALGDDKHVLWHSVYIGFGFLNYLNPDNISYDDTCGEKKVQSIVPDLTLVNNTEAYEAVLKEEVFKLIRHHFMFVIMTLFAKLGVLLFYLLKFANVGLLAAWFFPKSRIEEFIWFVSGLVYALFPLITVPAPGYAFGFITCATLYGIVSINYVLESGIMTLFIDRFRKKIMQYRY